MTTTIDAQHLARLRRDYPELELPSSVDAEPDGPFVDVVDAAWQAICDGSDEDAHDYHGELMHEASGRWAELANLEALDPTKER